MIRILLDQNIPVLIAPWLQEKVGHVAVISSTRSLGMQRMTDEEIFFKEKSSSRQISQNQNKTSAAANADMTFPISEQKRAFNPSLSWHEQEQTK